MLVLCSGYLRSSQFHSRDGSPVRNHEGSQVHNRGDQHWLVILKGSSIIVVATSLFAVLFTTLVLEPVHETGMSPLKVFTTRVLPSSLAVETDTMNWNIIAVNKIFILQMCLFRTVLTACR